VLFELLETENLLKGERELMLIPKGAGALGGLIAAAAAVPDRLSRPKPPRITSPEVHAQG